MSVLPVLTAAYYRISDDLSDASIPEQREWVHHKAVPAHQLELLAEFEDQAIPGSRIESRPGLMALLDFCEDQERRGRPVQAVVCWDADRLSRADSFRTAAVIDRLREAGVSRLLTSEGWVDFDNELDRLLYNMKQDLSRSGYSKAVSKNVTRSRLDWAKAGKWAGAPPYGYRKDPDYHLIPYEDEAQWVRWMFHTYATTAASLGDLARELTAKGVKPPRGQLWRRDSIQRMLTNRAYCGDFLWNEERRGTYSRIQQGEVKAAGKVRKIPAGRRSRAAVKNDPEDIVVREDNHPALVDRDTFAVVARKLPQRCLKRTTPTPGGGEWIFSGMLFCGRCLAADRKGTMTGNRRLKPKLTLKYVCTANIQHGRGTCVADSVMQDKVLAAVADLIRENFTTPQRIARLRQKLEALLSREQKDEERDRQQMRERLLELEGQIATGNRNLALLPPDLLPAVVAQVQGWKTARDALAQQLTKAEQAAGQARQEADLVQHSLEAFQELGERITTAPPDKVRNLLAPLVERIIIHFEDRPARDPRPRDFKVEVELRPEVHHLLGTTRGPRSATGPCRSGRA